MNPLSKSIFVAVLFSMCMGMSAQDSLQKPITISGYAEGYYSYDLGQPAAHERASFAYSFNRHNEVNLNLGFIKVGYETSRIRGNLALMAGTYAQYNLAAEQSLLKNVYEANAGIRLSKTRTLWLDVGIMPSHIGFESAIGKDCWNLTRSIMADNSPYYEAGVKLNHTSTNGKWYKALLYLNGWQRIQRVHGNQTPAFGTQLTYKPTDKVSMNWSTFVGNDKPDSARQMRYFNNWYAQWLINARWSVIMAFDLGLEQKSRGSAAYNVWYTPVINLRYSLNDRIKLATRGEYYNDPNRVIISTGTTPKFRTWGYSMNLDYVFSEHALFRIEARGFQSQDLVFEYRNKPSHNNYLITSSLALSF